MNYVVIENSTILTPFSFDIDVLSGELDPQGQVHRRTLSDLHSLFINPTQGEDLVYEVRPVAVPTTNSNLLSSTTMINPGQVNGEYYMTKGHFHQVRDRAEFYIGLSGEGLLVMATEDGSVAVEQMRPGRINYVPGHWAHRSVNTGNVPFTFFAVYIADAGQDYATIERNGFPVAVIDDSGSPKVIPNPRYQKT